TSHPEKPEPGACAPGSAGRGERPSHSARDLSITLPSESALPGYWVMEDQPSARRRVDGAARQDARGARRVAVSERTAEPGFEIVAVAARELERGAVVQNHDVLAAEKRLQLLDLLEIHDGRAVDPHESRGVELVLEILHRLAQQMARLVDVDPHIASVGVDPLDFPDGEQGHLSPRLHHEPIEVARCGG